MPRHRLEFTARTREHAGRALTPDTRRTAAAAAWQA